MVRHRIVTTATGEALLSSAALTMVGGGLGLLQEALLRGLVACRETSMANAEYLGCLRGHPGDAPATRDGRRQAGDPNLEGPAAHGDRATTPPGGVRHGSNPQPALSRQTVFRTSCSGPQRLPTRSCGIPVMSVTPSSMRKQPGERASSTITPTGDAVTHRAVTAGSSRRRPTLRILAFLPYRFLIPRIEYVAWPVTTSGSAGAREHTAFRTSTGMSAVSS